jgi:hypothetical protein
MKWLIVEDALRDRTGHWLEYVSTFVRGLTALGDEVVVTLFKRFSENEGFFAWHKKSMLVLNDLILLEIFV